MDLLSNAAALHPSREERVDVDFSLAIHNQTGKYFIGRDLLETPDLPVGDVYYWLTPATAPPAGLYGKIIGRLQHLHIKAQATGGALRVVPRRRSRRPLLHLDPFTVPSTFLERKDGVLCHDLGHITHPHLFEPQVSAIYRRVFDELARVGPHLIFVSKASQAAFEDLYPAATPASTRVIYPAIRVGALRTPPREVANIRAPFLLTVGSIGHRKNHLRCIEAFARSGLAATGVSYVIAGGAEPGFEEVCVVADATPGVVRLAYVDDAELSWLYDSAAGFVLVSQLEGFGMPVAEAIARGLVPLVTRNSVLEEVAGAGALVADADDADEIAERMIELAHVPKIKEEARMNQLQAAITRFGGDAIRGQWRAAFNDMVAFDHGR